MMKRPEAIEWRRDSLSLLDQRKLPLEVSFIDCRTADDVACAIETLAVRGAPAIGIAAAYGVVLDARSVRDAIAAVSRLSRTRPTAVNLFHALERMHSCIERSSSSSLRDELEREALRIHSEDIAANERIGDFGQDLLPSDATVYTHCNAGALATGGFGTALGVIRAAVLKGKSVRVLADETRPMLQGARLTAWELSEDNIDVTVVCEGMAAAAFSRYKIDAVLVGADRVASNGDTANKIGTYTLALAAAHFGVPVYVAAPWSTVDMKCPTGNEIPLEERNPDEIRECFGKRIMPSGFKVWNPSFDITPATCITAIITERGVAFPPFSESLAALCDVTCLSENERKD